MGEEAIANVQDGNGKGPNSPWNNEDGVEKVGFGQEGTESLIMLFCELLSNFDVLRSGDSRLILLIHSPDPLIEHGVQISLKYKGK